MAPRGGYREGAGRPALKTSERRVSLTVRVTPQRSRKLKALAKASKESLSAIIEDLIDKA